ncbi:MAG: hypothetical protein ACI8RD_009159 [Bacillariaceae sp.]|jgi:hypothetical protein
MTKGGDPSSTTDSSQSIDVEIKPHLKTTIYFTFAFCIAWAWDLMIYGISHVRNGTNPLEMQLSFGDQPGPKKIVVLCMEFLFSCAAAAVVTDMLDGDNRKWKKGMLCLFFLSSTSFSIANIDLFCSYFKKNTHNNDSDKRHSFFFPLQPNHYQKINAVAITAVGFFP